MPAAAVGLLPRPLPSPLRCRRLPRALPARKKRLQLIWRGAASTRAEPDMAPSDRHFPNDLPDQPWSDDDVEQVSRALQDALQVGPPARAVLAQLHCLALARPASARRPA
jgi:hypothetical protein